MRLLQHENETRTPKKRSDKLANGFSLALSTSANRYRLNIGKFDGKICLNVDAFKGKNAVLYYLSIKMPNTETLRGRFTKRAGADRAAVGGVLSD